MEILNNQRIKEDIVEFSELWYFISYLDAFAADVFGVLVWNDAVEWTHDRWR